ncbi:MAG: T9SS type A sorting domain-containing protein [Bacteroidia bacterium]|nr:T9SS type A sorting domain-containing protein [Bacteroidia bacterium]
MRFFTILLCLLISARVHALVNTGMFLVKSTKTYVIQAGGTALGSTTSDDQIYLTGTTGSLGTQTGTGFSIGFTFSYNGVSYTQFGVSTNGYIKLGNLPSFSMNSNTYYQDIQATGDGLLLSALNYDLQGQTGSSLQYILSGTAPTRVLTVQWFGFRSYNQTGDNYNFQIKLYEDSSKVEFCYGAFTHNSTSETARVGLYGITNADFLMRTHASNWATTANGSANSSNIAFNGSCYPPNGLTFTYYPISILPVTFTEFNVAAKGDYALLNWGTASETNNDYFTVEHSANGQLFEETGRIKGAGTSSQMHSYTFVHENPVEGINYYRIKQTDFNGDFSYSVLRSVYIGKDPPKTVTVFPNPCATGLPVTFSIPAQANSSAMIEIYTHEGVLADRINILPANDGELIYDSNKLSAGLYFYRVYSGAEIHSGKLLVLSP